MQWFVENTERIGNCGENAYIFARDNFQASGNTKNIENLYQKVIGANTLSCERNERENKNLKKRLEVKTDMWNNLQSRAEQSRAEQSRAEQSRAEQSRAEQSRAEQSR